MGHVEGPLTLQGQLLLSKMIARIVNLVRIIIALAFSCSDSVYGRNEVMASIAFSSFQLTFKDPGVSRSPEPFIRGGVV